MKEESTSLITNHIELLKYLKKKTTLIHMSNVFLRDIHYGVMSYLQEHGKKVSYLIGEKITQEVAAGFEKAGIFKKIDHQSWLLNYPEFALPRVEKVEKKAV